jgi:hypothetical protein
MNRERRLRISVLWICPFLLLATFVTGELALCATIDPAVDRFTAGFRTIVFGTLFFPWLFGALLGHWYHPYLDRDVSGWTFVWRLAILLAVAGALGLMGGLLLKYADGFTMPYWVSTLVMGIGVVAGAWLWPVRVYSRI